MDQIEAGLGDRLRWKCNVGCDVPIRHRSRQCGPQPATRRQVARELVPEVRARDGREGDVERGYKSDYFVGADQDIQTAIILFDSHKSR